MLWSIALLLLFICLFLFVRRNQKIGRYLGTFLLAAAGLFLTVSMVRAPGEAFDSALQGLRVWWDVVFPALLPFFIGSEILMGLGVVNFMGVLLEPLMRPLFNVPGVGSFVMAMGLASGYPIGAILTRRLRQSNLCNQVEAERLISFSNTADPLFMIGAVAIGMFGNAKLGVIIAIAHYISALLVGLCMRFYRRHEPQSEQLANERGNILVRACKELYRAKQRDGRPLGQLLGDAVKNSINSLLVVGGFIILFSVIMRIATVTGLVAFVSQGVVGLLSLLGLAPSLGNATISGLFEITIGCNVTSATVAPIMQRIVMAGAIIAWSGLSVHAQVAAVVNDTDIRMLPYIIARALHAVFAGICTWLLWPYLGESAANTLALPAFLQTTPAASLSFFWQRFAFMGSRVGLVLLGLLILSAAYHSLRRLNLIAWRHR